jgi:hypothetical protein
MTKTQTGTDVLEARARLHLPNGCLMGARATNSGMGLQGPGAATQRVPYWPGQGLPLQQFDGQISDAFYGATHSLPSSVRANNTMPKAKMDLPAPEFRNASGRRRERPEGVCLVGHISTAARTLRPGS